jgi:hypothetical protein
MMGRLNHDQRQFFYSFCLEEAVPDDHPVRGTGPITEGRVLIKSRTVRQSLLMSA